MYDHAQTESDLQLFCLLQRLSIDVVLFLFNHHIVIGEGAEKPPVCFLLRTSMQTSNLI